MRLEVEGRGDVWVEGELSDLSRAASGHLDSTPNDGSRRGRRAGELEVFPCGQLINGQLPSSCEQIIYRAR